MTAVLLLLTGLAAPMGTAPTAPLSIVVQTARGESRIPVQLDALSSPVLPAPALLSALGASAVRVEGWAEIAIAGRSFRFLLGAPLYTFEGKLRPLAGAASVRRDTLLLPIQFLSEVLPRSLGNRFRYDARAARLVDNAPVAVRPRVEAADPNRLPNGLRKGHVVTVDAGHGGVDPGNPGLYFPRGVREKHVTLEIALLLRDELRQRGVKVVMTRSRDTLIDLYQRGSYCTQECDLFISIHVNSLNKRAGYTRVRGFETYFLAEAKTEDAARVARMENEAVRFDRPGSGDDRLGGLDFLLKDLQLNEHLRESARAAELVQFYLQEAHTGPDLGVKQAGLVVLTTARRPSILVEVGFSTNPDDAKLLATPASQKDLAASMADAVVAYLLEYERKVGEGSASAVTGRAGTP
ncbi:MAG TPA: N-acetylmuramoyl-L-alanine amidase [Gemmatimonadales bacterium]